MLLDMIIRSCGTFLAFNSLERSCDRVPFVTHPLYLILELGNAVHMRQVLQHCAAG